MASLLFLGALVAACAYALKCGGAGERAAALLMILTALWSMVSWSVVRHFGHLSHERGGVIEVLVGDGILSVGFLVLAVRYGSLWLGAALMIQGAEFALNALYLGDPDASRALYAARVTAVSWIVVVCLATGAHGAQRRRRRRRAETAREAAAPSLFAPLPQ